MHSHVDTGQRNNEKGMKQREDAGASRNEQNADCQSKEQRRMIAGKRAPVNHVVQEVDVIGKLKIQCSISERSLAERQGIRESTCRKH